MGPDFQSNTCSALWWCVTACSEVFPRHRDRAVTDRVAQPKIDQADTVVWEYENVSGADVAVVNGIYRMFAGLDSKDYLFEQVEALEGVAVEWVGVG